MAARQTPGRSVAAILLVAAVVSVAACGSGPTSPAPSVATAPSAAIASAAPSSDPSAAPAESASPTPAPTLGQPLASSGSIVVLANDSSLWLVESTGTVTQLASTVDGAFAFPAWSPDGTRIAAIRYNATENAILVFDPSTADDVLPIPPQVIFRSPTIGPFYLSWTPDGDRVSFLASGDTALSLRVAPADGSAPLDGSGPGATIGTGSPYYFDWIDGEHLMTHVGEGDAAQLGEIGLDGAAVGPAVASPGAFRSAVVSPDGRYVSYIRSGTDGESAVVLAERDGGGERTMPVFGYAAVGFDPTGDTVASIGPTAPDPNPITLPAGPLRLLDPSGDEPRTLLDGRVLSFWWSPDGKTIAALRVQPVGASAPSAEGVAATPSDAVASPAASAAPAPTEARVIFVDVATGDVSSEVVVVPGKLFVDQFLTFFDQYALSHRIWAPDSTSLLFPVVTPNGGTRVAVLSRDGSDPILLDGQAAFWSP